MADVIAVKVNIPDFKRQLLALGRRMEKNIARRGIRAAGAVFVAETRRRAPVLREPRKGRVAGALRRAIRSVSQRSQRGELRISVGVRTTRAQSKLGVDPFYWRFLEDGWIPRGPGKRFKGGERRRRLERERAIAAGAEKITKYKFLEPAFKAVGHRALEAFNQAVSDGIAKEGRR